ncbi:MAG TPA: protein phosphatase 2C domain-containing protein [Pyrinomonadaceae bacterium]|nr:protein phosphatase 2C domain-containing protein [Pyrinomonadaceae bacterium]
MKTKRAMSTEPEYEKPADETPPPPFSSLVSVDVCGMTDKGHVRTQNEDHFLVLRGGRAVETVMSNLGESQPGDLFEEAAFAMVVADGVGGEAAGEVASRQAIYTLLGLTLHTPDWNFRWGPRERNTVMWRLKDRFRRVNAALMREAAANASLSGMCTTMTAAISQGDDLIIGHVGDSRAYLLHDGKLIRLTRDHTLGERLVEDGTHKPNDHLVRELRNVLMQALGSRETECVPDVHDYVLEDGDQVMLCTDGLSDMVEDPLIESVLKEASSAETACQSLIDLALSNGGRDNITVVVARYSIPTRE